MPTAERSLIFDFAGAKGLVSKQMAHNVDPQTFLVYSDLYNDSVGRRRKRPGIGSPIDSNAAGAEITAMHWYTRVDPSTGVVTEYQFRAVGSTISRYNSGTGLWVNCVMGGVSFAGTAWRFCNYRNRCWAVNGVDGLFFFDGTTRPDGGEWYVAGQAGGTASLGYSLIATDAPYSTGTINVQQGQAAVVGSGTAWNSSGSWSGKTIAILGVNYVIQTVTDGTHLTLTTSYAAVNNSTAPYTIYPGLMNWVNPPTYTYAYLNSATGHVTNAGPYLTLTETNQFGRTVQIIGIPHSSAAYNNGYDKIQIFRSPVNGFNPLAINAAFGGQINNANDNLTVTFTETTTTYQDIDLTSLEAPFVENRPPLNGSTNPPDTSVCAAVAVHDWNGRLWLLAPREAKVYYSAGVGEISYGRPEECFPANNNLTIADGKDLLKIGSGQTKDALIISTGRDVEVVSGNDVLNFGLRKLPVLEENVGNLLNGAIPASDSFIQLVPAIGGGAWLLDYTANDPNIASDIQDLMFAIPSAYLYKARMARATFQNRKLLLLSVPSGAASTTNDVTYVFDYFWGCWYKWTIGFSALMVTKNGSTGAAELWGAVSAGGPANTTQRVYKLLQPSTYQDNGANFAPAMTTGYLRDSIISGPMSQNGLAIGAAVVRQSYGLVKSLRWFRAFVSDRTQTWQIKVHMDEDELNPVETVPLEVPNVRWDQSPKVMIASFVSTPATLGTVGHKKRYEVIQFEVIWPSVNADLWIEHMEAVAEYDQITDQRQ